LFEKFPKKSDWVETFRLRIFIVRVSVSNSSKNDFQTTQSPRPIFVKAFRPGYTPDVVAAVGCDPYPANGKIAVPFNLGTAP
jgi:hypothetical protein